MAMSVKEFLALNLEERANKVAGCTACRNPIYEHPEEQYTIDHKPVCSDCYFNRLGEFIEKHPIYTPRVLS